MLNISGQKDPIIKLIRDLQKEEGRINKRLYFCEGNELVKRAFTFGQLPEYVIITEKYTSINESLDIVSLADSANVPIYLCSEGLLNKILNSKPTPECIAVLKRQTSSLDDILSVENPFIMMVENCENQDNLGMLLRTTDAVGVSSVLLSGDTVDPFSRRVVRGSRGAVYTVPICIHKNTSDCIKQAKTKDIQIIATSANTETFYTSIDFTKPSIIVVGNEHTGISEEVRNTADKTVKIPMLGKINSLNIAVAASIMMYEVVRQRKK
ncbi:MAG: RNA methyltransferase [Armatimonadota bacterium]